VSEIFEHKFPEGLRAHLEVTGDIAQLALRETDAEDSAVAVVSRRDLEELTVWLAGRLVACRRAAREADE
jgi:hypothetical protein